MDPNMGFALIAVASMFAVFMAALAYGAWMTRGVKLAGSTA